MSYSMFVTDIADVLISGKRLQGTILAEGSIPPIVRSAVKEAFYDEKRIAVVNREEDDEMEVLRKVVKASDSG
eukprot:2223565-Rhodomonas_salina.5